MQSTALRFRVVLTVCLTWCAITATRAHPGSGIVVDGRKNVYFVDTGQGVWKLAPGGKPTRVPGPAYHWMALDEHSAFARSGSLGEFDRGSFVRVAPGGSAFGLILSSDYPIAVGRDDNLYYVPYNASGPRELIKRSTSGRRTVFARLPPPPGPDPARWVNGITVAPDGTLYVSDDDAIRRIDRSGAVSVFREAIEAPDCSDPLPGVRRLPYLRELAVARNGTVYAAANGCRAVIAIPAKGPIRTILKSEAPWSPTAVAVSGEDILVLEYLHTPGDDRRQWTPRVRKVAPGGSVTTLATIVRGKD